MKKIEDFLHLYWGCDCQYRGLYSEEIKTWVINEKTIKRSSTKPILRKLESMTEEEAKQVTSICEEQFVYYNIFKERIQITTTSTINGDKEDSAIWLFYDGQITLYRNNGDLGGSRMEQLKNPFELFRYLLKQGFDLFSLIDSGSAIDKSTLK